jgi:hypothetical protein
MAWVAIVVSVALVLVLGLALIGIFGGSSYGATPAVTFSSARNTSTQASPAGAWALDSAIGIDLANATTVPLNWSAEANCTVTSYSGTLPNSITIPSFGGNLTSGVAPEWVFGYIQPSNGAELEVLVTGGVATLVYELSGARCGETLPGFTGIPSTVVDSPSAVAAASAAGAEAFLEAHPTGVSAEMGLIDFIGEGMRSAPMWDIIYTTCTPVLGPNSTETPGSEFSVEVNATTGIVAPGSVQTGACGGSTSTTPIGQALTLGFPTLVQGSGSGGTVASQGCASGDMCYELSIEAAADNVTPGDFDVAIESSTDSLYPSVGFAITNAQGEVVVYAMGSEETSWTSAFGTSDTLLTSQMTIVADVGTTPPTGTGWTLELIGTGPFANSEIGYGLG